MESACLEGKAETYLRKLCLEIPTRRVGSPGNRAATEFFAGKVSEWGFATETTEFACVDWEHDGADFKVGGISFKVMPSPYSLGCRVSAPLVVVSTIEELASADVSDGVLLLRGDIAGEPLMPKNFPFYNPDSHRQIIRLLESKKPRAIVTAPVRNPQMIGAVYPYPLIEDGDFDIPSVYVSAEDGVRLAQHSGQVAWLESRAWRIPSRGCNVIARKGVRLDRRVVLFAHIDARMGSPGANDNASGVTSLLLLAELLTQYSGRLGVELVALNGEDYYSNPGEQMYLASNAGLFGEILLGVNLDDVGYHRGRLAYSLYGCPANLADTISRVFSAYPGLVEGEAWYQGDHGLFLMNNVPALAITADLLAEVMAEITHSPRDRPETVDTGKLVTTAFALRDLLYHLDCRLAQID